MITITWSVTGMTAYPEKAGETDVVFNVAWCCTATDGTFTTAVPGSIGVTWQPGSPFTPYDQLTQAQVLGWVYAATPPEYIANMEAVIAQNIADQANPPTVTLPLPWNIPAPPPPDMSEPPAPVQG